MALGLHIVEPKGKAISYSLRGDMLCRLAQTVDMTEDHPDRPRNHLKAWRLYRRMTQAQLADAIGSSKAVIGHLESGERGLSDKWLMKLAPVLNTTPGYLLTHDPEALPTDMLDLWNNIPDDKRADALAILKALSRTGTDG